MPPTTRATTRASAKPPATGARAVPPATGARAVPPATGARAVPPATGARAVPPATRSRAKIDPAKGEASSSVTKKKTPQQLPCDTMPRNITRKLRTKREEYEPIVSQLPPPPPPPPLAGQPELQSNSAVPVADRDMHLKYVRRRARSKVVEPQQTEVQSVPAVPVADRDMHLNYVQRRARSKVVKPQETEVHQLVQKMVEELLHHQEEVKRIQEDVLRKQGELLKLEEELRVCQQGVVPQDPGRKNKEELREMMETAGQRMNLFRCQIM